MSQDLALAFVVFAIATLFTPGPNNIMLMASGLNFGLARTVPHGIGVPLGFGFMVLVIGFGLGAFFAAFPVAYEVLKYVGAAYLLYLAWRIATSASAHGTAGARPFTFFQAVAFQWVNAKAWVMAIGAVTAYAGIMRFPANMLVIAAIFTVLGICSSFTWVLFGTGLKRLVNDPRAIRIFNLTMAALLAASLIPVFLE